MDNMCVSDYLLNDVNDLHQNVMLYQKKHETALQKYSELLSKYQNSNAEASTSNIKKILNDLAEDYDFIIKYKDIQDKISLNKLDQILIKLDYIEAMGIKLKDADKIREMCEFVKNIIKPTKVESSI